MQNSEKEMENIRNVRLLILLGVIIILYYNLM